MYRLLFYITLSLMGVNYHLLFQNTSGPKPYLVTASDSTRAIALTSLTSLKEPFVTTSTSTLYGQDNRTRICVFAMNLALQPESDLTALTADAEDSNHHHYDLRVESATVVPGQEWLRQVVLRLNDDLIDQGDVLLSITYRGVVSNRVRIGIGHVGGGLPDDAGSGPTPGQLISIKGALSLDAQPLSNVSVSINGPQAKTVTTDRNGNYSLEVSIVGDYTLTPSSNLYAFTPATATFTNLNAAKTVDFSGALKRYSISGQVKGDDGNPLENIVLPLSSTNGLISQTATTGPDGHYIFTNLLATYSYVFTPYNSLVYTFPGQSVSSLDGDKVLNVTGNRNLVNVTGTITDKANVRISGVTVALTGAVSRTTVTDANGNFTFSQLPAGKDYYLTPAKEDYIFEPQTQFVNFLFIDQRQDFTAVKTYKIIGNVTNASGKGLIGVTMFLSGPQSASTSTGPDGSYSFLVTATGSYILSPFKEQSTYIFTPSSRTLSVNANQTANFNGELAPITSPTYVLEFDGTAKLDDHGQFWSEGVDLGHFFWEFWAMPGDDADFRYLLSDGYGGSHALLFGFAVRTDLSRYNLFGNVWNGTASTYYVSEDGPAPHEWGHFAVGWDGKNITTYFNGVPVGKQPFAGPRRSMGPAWGAGWLFIGGSDHQNFTGRIAQVRGFEGSDPREGSAEASFVPQTIFSLDGNLLSYYFRPSQTVADLSFGYDGVAHTGLLKGVPDGIQHPCPTCPGPIFVLDPTAPDFANTANPGHINARVDPAPSTPAGARIFDSFSRTNSTYILGGRGGLGATETGSAGVKTWTTNVDASQLQPFGILNGKAVLLGNNTSLAWVPTGSATADMEVQVSRKPIPLASSGQNTGLAFRVTDSRSYFFAYTSDDPEDSTRPKKLTLGYYQAGVVTLLASSVSLPDDWTKLRVLTRQSGTIDVYADDTQVYSTSNTVMSSATGAGLYNCAPNMALTNRWDNFTVFDLQ